jgi:hypothetical protein
MVGLLASFLPKLIKFASEMRKIAVRIPKIRTSVQKNGDEK